MLLNSSLFEASVKFDSRECLFDDSTGVHAQRLVVPVVVAAWVHAFRGVKRACYQMYQNKKCRNGALLRISACKLVTQLGLLPLLLFAGSPRQNVPASSRTASQIADTAASCAPCVSFSSSHIETAFFTSFFLFIADDFFEESTDAPLLVHHVACLLGLVVGYMRETSGLYAFAAGITAFEIGSGSVNVYCLNDENDAFLYAYAAIMTLSNGAGWFCCQRWLRCIASPLRRCLGLLLTLMLIGFRSGLMLKTWRSHMTRRHFLQKIRA